MTKAVYIELRLSWGWNNNKEVLDANILDNFSLRGVPMTTIDGISDRMSENCWEALSIFRA